MLSQSLLLKCFYYAFIMIHFLQSSSGKGAPHNCSPSTCGHIRNISYPFRLKDDPQHCGDSRYQLSCENNTASVYIKSQKYHVQAINYENHTIRLNDPTVQKHDKCSFPRDSLTSGDLVDVYSYWRGNERMRPITFMSCPHPLSNSALLVETTKDCFNHSGNYTGHTYIRFGYWKGSHAMHMCTIDLMVMTSLIQVEDEKGNVSLSEIHSSLLYGFELSFGNWSAQPRCIGIQTGAVLGVALGLALRILVGVPLMLGLLIYKLRKRHMPVFDVIEGFLQSNSNLVPIRYCYSDIKTMTRGFQEKLGEGGYGSVYKGKLRSGHDVAVKVLSKPKAMGQDFINEVATIGRIHHVNVVKLVGYCAERSKRALVYEFMPNGSLEKHIFGPESANTLSWERKYEIAVGVAHGIEYLHQGCDIQILHFDIKPQNILLNDNFTPKISDFGLAKFYCTKNNTVTLSAARGTIGYVAPELINRSIGKVSYKADVYSFGMLLMEMVGLKKNVVATGDDESSKYFPYWIYDRLNEGKDIQIENADEYAKSITRKMTIVGLWCIQINPSHRPSMGDVLKMLDGDSESLQIPPLQPSLSQSHQTTQSSAETWEIGSTDSMNLLDDDASIA